MENTTLILQGESRRSQTIRERKKDSNRTPEGPSEEGVALSSMLDIDEQNLAYRKEYIRLGDEERQTLLELVSWAEEHAADLIKKLYDWQFSFSRTEAFFKKKAKEGGISLAKLRAHLESAQIEYFIGCFKGAETNWDVDYFESRLNIGMVHDRINLPFKWYISTYTELLELALAKLRDSFDEESYVNRAYAALMRVFFLDVQAIADAFLMSTIDALGFNIDQIETDEDSDRTEHLDQIKEELQSKKLLNADYEGQIAAISKSQAVIEFELDGTILSANSNFLDTVGYALEEVQGRHHSMFVEIAHAESAEYKEFWSKLGRGGYHSGEFKRVTKDGRKIWIQASYNPILDPNGVPFKVVKYATDITHEVNDRMDFQGQLEAISKSQAVIEFNVDGTIREANTNFLQAMGYSLGEIQGQHHSMFVEPAYAQSAEYRDFWAKLGRGEHHGGEFKRVTKDGREIWIQASYNPIFNRDGEVVKVVKYATDITHEVNDRMDFQGQLEAISKSQAVIEFNVDGTIQEANANFLQAMGYSLGEIQGQHHSMFVEPAYAQSAEYRDFWAKLGRGEHHGGEFKRVTKDGREIWIQASYNPIFNRDGEVIKVVKYATDITDQVDMRSNFQWQLEAISQSLAVVEIDIEGVILDANANILTKIGYERKEVIGTPYASYLAPDFAQSEAYKELLHTLQAGSFYSGELKLCAKNGDEIWLQASFNPRFDRDGNPFKAVQFASDITDQVNMRVYLESSFDRIDQNADRLSNISGLLSGTSESMEGNAEETHAQASGVAAAAEQVSVNIHTVAAGAEEMTASIKEVARNASEAAKVASQAVKAAEDTNVTVTKLGESSTEIGNVIKVITSIAQQTNLLALNATIEAARAGEAGKGFAVVANEVKELAKQTAQATEEIGQKIEAIQYDAKDVVQAINTIGQIINQINGIQGTITTAVEEQTSTTSEIARNVSEAAKGSAVIAENISSVASAAESTSEGALETKAAIKDLVEMSKTLQNIVDEYKNFSQG